MSSARLGTLSSFSALLPCFPMRHSTFTMGLLLTLGSRQLPNQMLQTGGSVIGLPSVQILCSRPRRCSQIVLPCTPEYILAAIV